MIKDCDLVFSEGVNQGTIDVVDGKAKTQNNHIFGHSCGVGVSIGRTGRHIRTIRRGIH